MQLNRVVLVVGLVLLAGVVTSAAFVLVRSRDSAPDAATIEDRLGEIVALHASANAATDPVIAFDILTEARNEIDAFAETFPDGQVDKRVLDQQQSIVNDIDTLTRVSRLESIQIIGGVPAPPPTTVPQMFTGNGKVFVLTDALYQFDSTTSSLVRLIGPGDDIGGREVGALLGAAWRADGPLVIDGDAAYVFDLFSGEITVEPLGRSEETSTLNVTALDIFDFNLYVLDAENGRIIKFAGGDYDSPPEDWTEGQASGDLSVATDMVVDGNIFVSMADGTVLNFFLSTLNDVLVPEIVPAFDSTDAVVSRFGGQYFYLVNREDGRIARLDRDGNLVQQFIPIEGSTDLTDIRDIVVDEETGIAMILAGNALYTTRLPAPVAGSTP